MYLCSYLYTYILVLILDLYAGTSGDVHVLALIHLYTCIYTYTWGLAEMEERRSRRTTMSTHISTHINVNMSKEMGTVTEESRS